MNEAHYYRVDLEYIQSTSLLVAAETPQQAEEMIAESVEPGVRGFKILKTTQISEAEKTEILDSVNQEGRTIN